jgi:HlyD family secretion protein
MTANVSIPVDHVSSVLKVPNAALRFRPDPGDLAEAPDDANKSRKKETVVYVMNKDGKLQKIPVKTSITDGNFTAIESTQLAEGQNVVVGLMTARVLDTTGGMQQDMRRRR